MKKLQLQLKLTLMSVLASLMLVMSCKTEDPIVDPVDEFLPVLNENFSFEVEGNNVKFTTTINGNVWVTTNGVDYPFVDKAITVNLPNKGDYSFTCSSLGSGETKTSAAFTVTIAQDDLGFLNVGFWKHLSGGANQSKTWRMDMNADGKCVYFAGPMYYSGYSTDERKTEWSYWAWDVLPEQLPYTVNGAVQNTFFNWTPDYPGHSWIMAPGNYGTITFNGTTGVVSTNVFGEEKSGSFTFDTATWKLNLTGVILPIDTARLNEPQYTDEFLGALRVFSLTDSAMQIGIRRTYEGENDNGTQKVSEWVNVYNFVVVGYNYPVVDIPEVDVVWPNSPTAVTTDVPSESAKFAGNWKVKNVPDWNSYYPGFWNFHTMTNDAPSTYMGTNQQGNVFWDPFIPGAGDTWANPNAENLAKTMIFDATALTLKITDGTGAEIGSGTYKTDGLNITTEGVVLVHQSGNTIHSPNTWVIASIPDAPVAGDEMKVAMYQCDGSCGKNEWVLYTYVKQ